MEQSQSCSFPTTTFMAAAHRLTGRDTLQEAARCLSLPAPHEASSRPLHGKGETQTGSRARDSDGLLPPCRAPDPARDSDTTRATGQSQPPHQLHCKTRLLGTALKAFSAQKKAVKYSCFYLQYLEIELGVYSWPLLYTNLPPERFQHRLTQGSFQSIKHLLQLPIPLWLSMDVSLDPEVPSAEPGPPTATGKLPSFSLDG